MQFDPHYHPYTVRRTPTYARRGMVATSQPLAAQAGLEMLKEGGNAIDAAIATAAALTVLEPCSNGIGGDAFAMVWAEGRLHGLNASGPAPRGISADAVRAAGHEHMPAYGPLSVTVPGAPAAWAALAERFGRLPLEQLLEPAASYAEQGYAVSPTVAHYWAKAHDRYVRSFEGPHFRPWFETFAPDGRTPHAGELWRSADHARTLRRIGESGAEAFYRGELARLIADFVADSGGYLREEDLADYRPEWTAPFRVGYRGYDIWELPPNGQGLVALQALKLLEGTGEPRPENLDTLHRQIEAVKLAFADGYRYIADPAAMELPPEALLDEAYAARRRMHIGERAGLPTAGHPRPGGTVYLAAADGEGRMVSFIQSNFMQFGSGLVVPGTGIALQNRGHSFSLDACDTNVLAPGKRPFHTIIPGFVTKDGSPIGPFGVMGGAMQPQGHVQVLAQAIDFGRHPQAALDAPRWQWTGGRGVLVESSFPPELAQGLAGRGHEVRVALEHGPFGRGQIIWRDPVSGVLCGGTDSRADGIVAAW
ncbi:gamma-glutamyltransferase family protein [Paenibacillus sp. IB182496]|uniref:Gamma-glutamyltransferase family protein n=1 Tax=Paenibacillus sabuli TaxID=2772509 RepID=A0A927BTX8_9BACL|nr:gamma-glutamyltransferase family protein [Paenibacillus sabuli]MBD2846747.1 gamma-glutamyltransferase family protein [Paenibacillus sabuli]